MKKGSFISSCYNSDDEVKSYFYALYSCMYWLNGNCDPDANEVTFRITIK